MKDIINNTIKGTFKSIIMIVLMAGIQVTVAQSEDDYYRITTVPTPEGVKLEGGCIVTSRW